jgi:hypothetical protein
MLQIWVTLNMQEQRNSFQSELSFYWAVISNCRGGPPWPPDWDNPVRGSRNGRPRRAALTIAA